MDKRVQKALLIIISIAIIMHCSCEKNSNDIIITEQFHGTISVNEWIDIGPFEFDTLKQNPKSTYFNKDLESYGIDETSFKENDLLKFKDSKIKPSIIKCANSPIKLFDYIDKKSFKNKSNFYLYTNIVSESEKEIVFIFDGSCNYKIWINKIQVLEVRNKENTIKNGDRFLRIQLHKGNNSVFAKVNRGNNQYSWVLSMVLASDMEAGRIYKWNYLKDFVNDPFISDSISLYLGPYSNARLQITDFKDSILFSRNCFNKYQNNFHINCKELPEGLHQAKLFAGNDTLEEMIYKGNFFNFIKELKFEAQQLNCEKNVKEDIKAAVDRLDFLIEKLDESSEAGIRYYHRNLLYYANNLSELIKYTKKVKNDRLFPGTILKTWYSEKDTTVYQFLFHANERLINNKPFPVIFLVPYALTDRTMSRSWYIGNLDQMQADMSMADIDGFALVWLFMKGEKYTPQNAAIEVKEVIKRIKEDYNPDTNKIYLIGDCVGGKRALLLAEKYPDLFSGIVVRAPVTMNDEGNNKPVNFIENLYNIPICIKHGVDDNEVPIADSRKFIEMASTTGQKIKLIETGMGHLAISRDERKYAFEYLDSLKNNPKKLKPYLIKYITCDNDPVSVYWIKIEKTRPNEKAEIEAKYNPEKLRIDITCTNLKSLLINTKKLEIQRGKKLQVYVNRELKFSGDNYSENIQVIP